MRSDERVVSSLPSVGEVSRPLNHDHPVVAAEIEPVAGRAQAAARGLQRLGFRVLHIGPTISVEGPKSLWAATFNVSFEPRQTTTVSELGPDRGATYQEAGAVNIPAELEGLVHEVAFVRPPEFF
ncbi:MAG: hypothetical protein M3O70_04995 [Actinomycetota bacterium]|nr:hypothetical protein [Actinomycetota bacterium]